MAWFFSYAGLFLWSFLAATLVPLGSEVALVLLVRSEHHWIVPVLVATVGNYLGACTTYWIGRRAAQYVHKQRGERPNQQRAARLFARWGAVSLLLSWVPIIGDTLVAVAGATHIPLRVFSFWVILGKGLRYAVVAWGTWVLMS